MSLSSRFENIEMAQHLCGKLIEGYDLSEETAKAMLDSSITYLHPLLQPALDRTLKALGLSLYHLLNPHELARYAAVPALNCNIGLLGERCAAAA